VPPNASIDLIAEAENAFAVTSNFAVKVPLPRIFTSCEVEINPASKSVSRLIDVIFFASASFCKVSILIALYSTRLIFIIMRFQLIL
jgi:hypothetical protein